MESKIKFKNILILLFFFLIGFFANLLLLNWKKIDIYTVLSSINKDTTLEQIPVVDNTRNEVCEVKSEDEEIEDLCPVLVDIGGAVVNPGVYCFEKGASVIDAVKKAKGLTPDAGLKYISMRINLATVMLDNSKIYIPFETDYDCSLLTFNLPKEVVEITIPDTEVEEDQEGQESCISINTATQQELDSLDGVGPSTAQKIIDGRPYTALEDLLNVSGIGESTFNGFKDMICL